MAAPLSFFHGNTNRIIARAPKDALTLAPVAAFTAAHGEIYDKATGDIAALGADDLFVEFVGADLVCTCPEDIAAEIPLKTKLLIVLIVDRDAETRLMKELDAKCVANQS